MRMHPTKILNSACRFLLFLIILSCSKDSDLIYDAISELEEPAAEEVVNTNESENSGESTNTENTETNTEENTGTPTEDPRGEEPGSEIPDGFESRTTSFPPSQDAHIQSGQGYNQQIIRLDEGNRISYVLFDLQPITDIGGMIVEAHLEFTTQGDEGDGTINVYKGDSANWTETNLNEGSAPDPSTLLGSIVKEYTIGVTEEVTLVTESLKAEATTLILDHKDGNDLALASKEHPSTDGPHLVVTYYAPVDAPLIEPAQNQQESNSGNQAPMAVADANPATGNAPLEVNFSGANSTDDAGIVSYAWDFGDGASATTVNPTHTYTELGQYQATLTVSDEEGLTSTDSVTINVTDQQDAAPVAVATANPTSGPAPLQVSFTGSNSTDDDAITSYLWDFQDNELSAAPNPTYTFNTPGTYDVTLTVKDTSGQENTTTITITVTEEENQAPVANASATPLSGTAPLEVSFSSNGSNDDKGITGYVWNFKDGQSSSAQNPTHTFTAPGTYQVSLTVTDAENLSDTDTVTITVNASSNEAPNAVAAASVTSGDAPLTVNFNSSGSSDDNGITSYFWDFSTNDPSSLPNPSRTFNTPGTYLVTLTVTDGGGLTGTDTVTITVNDGGGSSGGGSTGNYPPGAVFASDFGYNSSDATQAFMDAIRSNATFIVVDKQSSDWVIQPAKFFNIQNKTIVFESGVVLRAKNGAFPGDNDRMVEFVNAINVTIEGYGATFKMNKSEYNSGEGRHTLSLVKCRDVTIKGITFRDSGGDGIMLASSQTGTPNENINIEDIQCINHRRIGLSVINARNVWVRNSQFIGSSGVRPETGVQIEPDFASDKVVNVNFINCKFKDNKSNGFHLAPQNLNSGSTPISVTIKNSEFSNNALSTTNPKPKSEILLQGADNLINGTVTFDNVTFNGSKYSILFSNKSANSYQVIFRNCSAYNIASNGNLAPLGIEASNSNSFVGGFTFDNFYIQYGSSQPFMKILGSSGVTLKNIIGDFTIKQPNDQDLFIASGINQSNNINVNINYTHVN